VQLAAEELQHTLAILTGAWLPIEAQAGGPALELALAAGEPEEHGWSVTAEKVTLWGTEPAAVLFAVYAFLEQVGGVSWLSEFEGGEVIPRRETLTVPFGEQRFQPRLKHRAFTNYPALDRRTVAMVDWMARHRCNRFMVFANVPGSLAAYDEVLRPELLARGLKLEIGHHSFRFLVPPEEHFATHPEYFAKVNGQRVPDGQLCTSHPAVVDLVAQRLGSCLTATRSWTAAACGPMTVMAGANARPAWRKSPRSQPGPMPPIPGGRTPICALSTPWLSGWPQPTPTAA
jgi:hypothetical protein